MADFFAEKLGPLTIFSPETGTKISGIGAALAGRGAQFDATQAAIADRSSAIAARTAKTDAAAAKVDLEAKEQRKKAMLLDNRQARRLIVQGNVPGAIKLLENRAQEVIRLGGDPSDTVGLLQQLKTDPKAALQEIINVDLAAIDAKLIPDFPIPKVVKVEDGVVTLQDASGAVYQEKLTDIAGVSKTKKVQKVIDHGGGIFTTVFKDGSNVVVQPKTEAEKTLIRDAEERKINLKEAAAAATGTGRGKAARAQEAINLGIESVQALPILRRSLDLMQRIGTGGFKALRQRVASTLGIEGADEGELSANLGRAVLAKLKETFGAQFTEKEGARLERLSATFGKSLKANRRILRSAMKVIETTAERALRAARASGDKEAEVTLTGFIDGLNDISDEGLAAVFTPSAGPGGGTPGGGTTPAFAPVPAPGGDRAAARAALKARLGR